MVVSNLETRCSRIQNPLKKSSILERLFDWACLTLRGGGHGCPGNPRRPSPQLQAVLDVRRQVVMKDGIPDGEELLVQSQGQGMISNLHGVPEFHAQGWDVSEDGGDRSVRPQGKGGRLRPT
jgi:hypothetical protein